MVFSSLAFLLLFLPGLALFYFSPLSRSIRAKNGVLLVFSLLFYAAGGLRFLPVLLLSILLNYTFGRLADAAHPPNFRKRAVWLAVGCNLSLLVLFKYTGFLTENLHALFPPVPICQIPLPIGISFFTFQGLSYVIDVGRGEVSAETNLPRLALYLALFPQLVAGPIVRYTDVAQAMKQRTVDREDIVAGLTRFLFGLSKKVLLADRLALIADPVFAQPSDQLSVGLVWLGLAAYGLQLYFDFSAYSDMAIGLGRIFGFHFPENFNLPYLSRSITEYWRRWHITLGAWFRDYLYIPLGGSRVSTARRLAILLVVWGLIGLWHGAAWNFLLWGLYYGILAMGEKFLWGKALAGLPRAIQHLYAVVLIFLGCFLFRSESLEQVLTFGPYLFGLGDSLWCDQATFLLLEYRWELVIAIVACLPLVPWLKKRLPPVVLPLAALGLGGLSLLFLVGTGYSPFLYFQF